MTIKHIFSLAALAAGLAFTTLPAQAVVAIIPPPPRPRPIPPGGWTYQWVAPVYRTVREQIWIPDRLDMVRDWVEVAPGRFEQVWRQVLTPGHFESTARTVLVSEGYWQLVRIEPPPMPPPHPVVIAPGTVPVEGYAPGATEDLSKFSPLREWPAK